MTQPTVPGRVSVVVVNYKGASDTITCLEGLGDVDWPDVEVVVVDNASGDGSAEVLAARFPEARLVALGENLGFAGGCNRGAHAATGEYVAFLNNDARPDPAWLRSAIAALSADASVGCVASKVLDWDGKLIDYVGGYLSFYGHGFKAHDGKPDSGVFDVASDTLFASGAAMVMPREVFLAAGSFDERFFMFFEDVDLGWRLWLLGYRVRYVPESVVFHRHHQSMEGLGSWKEHYLLERNALYTIYKNYDDDNLRRILPAALLLASRRSVALAGLDAHAFDLATGTRDDDTDSMASIPKETLARLYAIDGLVDALPELAEARKAIQARRRRSDNEILRLFGHPFEPIHNLPTYLEAFQPIVDALDVGAAFSERNRILIVTGDSLGERMAGPAIRAWQIARALGREHDVVLASTVACEEISHSDFSARFVTDKDLGGLVEWCDVIILQGLEMWFHPCLRENTKVVVADIYDPFHLEQLEQARDLGDRERRSAVRSTLDVLNQQLLRGDMFLCASDKQRDFWLGQLSALGRLNPATYDADERLDDLLRVVPFGVSDEAPAHTRPTLRGVVPGIGADDKVVIWGGGIYNWLDPLTLLHAIDKLRARVPEVRLFFLGLKHPNPHVPEMRVATQTVQLSGELGLTGTHVFFNEGWVAYEDRQNFLLEADIGVSTHLDHVETEFSFRTRILDYLWAGIPIVATGGDSFGDLVTRDGMGITVAPGDVDVLEEALFRLLDDRQLYDACAAAARRAADDFRWSKVLVPLVEYCRAPRRAADLADPDLPLGIEVNAAPQPGLRRDLEAVARLIREGDLSGLVAKSARRVKRALRS